MKRTGNKTLNKTLNNKTWILQAPYSTGPCLPSYGCPHVLPGSVWPLQCLILMNLIPFTRFEDSLCTLPGFSTPHDVQETSFNGWWEEGHSNVPPFNPWLGPQQGRTSKQSEQRCPSWEVSRISDIGPRALSHCQMHTDKTKHLLQRSNDVWFLLYSCQRRKRSLSQQRCKSFFWNRGSNKSCQAGETL